MLWCDDNWGNLRRLPTGDEQNRTGGAGIYYHFDYVGTPRSYKWLNTNPLPKIWEQMNMAANYGATRIWIVNVGDLKPMELPIEFFLRMAWYPPAIGKEGISTWTQRWAEREFGKEHAADIADLVSKYAKYNGWRKPELLEPSTFSLINYHEAETVSDLWQKLATQAEQIGAQLPPEYHDAYYELVLYPVKACAGVAKLHIETGFNQLYAKQGRASANDAAQSVRNLFQEDQKLSDAYHQVAKGKWNHMMAQPHIGYTSWNDPKTNILPTLAEVKVPDTASMGVSIEGSSAAWPGNSTIAKLPTFDAINQQRQSIDIFRRGTQAFPITLTANQPWVKLSTASVTVDKDQRVWVSIDWDKASVGQQNATVTITGPSGESVLVQLETLRDAKFTKDNVHAFGGLTGPVAIDASQGRNMPTNKFSWEPISDYGRGLSAMEVFPVNAESILPPKEAPHLDYPVFVPKAGQVHVDLITGPTLNVQPDRGVRIAVSFDDQPPQVVDAYAGQGFTNPTKRSDSSAPATRDWSKWVKDNARTIKSDLQITEAGVHTLKVWMVDPGVPLEKIIVHTDALPSSYFGPPVQPGLE
ncbi:MAG: glycosyl hydrolase 115 family protein [Chthoniobacteraceae bacterium]